MSPSSSQIEREVETSRAQLEETVEALKEKMSLGQMVNEASRYFGESGGAEVLARLGEQVKANPLPLTLVGVGLAWLMSGRGQPHLRSRRDEYGYGYDPDYESDATDAAMHRSAGVYEGAAHPNYASRSTGTHDAWPSADPPSESAGVASGISSAVSGVAGSVAHAAGAAASALGSAASAASRAGRTAASAAGSLAGGARSGAGAALRGGSRAYRGASHMGSGAYGGASALGSRAKRRVSDALESDPLVLGAVGLAFGAAIAALLPRTDTEDHYLGETRDRLREDAAAYARGTYEQGVKAAEEAYRTALAEAEAQGLTTTGEGSLAGKISEVARAALDKARHSAAGHDQSTGSSNPPSGTAASYRAGDRDAEQSADAAPANASGVQGRTA